MTQVTFVPVDDDPCPHGSFSEKAWCGKKVTKNGKNMKEKDRVVKNYEFVFICHFVFLILFQYAGKKVPKNEKKTVFCYRLSAMSGLSGN